MKDPRWESAPATFSYLQSISRLRRNPCSWHTEWRLDWAEAAAFSILLVYGHKLSSATRQIEGAGVPVSPTRIFKLKLSLYLLDTIE